jgi:hypothetical protein
MKRTDKRLRRFWEHDINPISGYVIRDRDDKAAALKDEVKKYYRPAKNLAF